MVPELKMGVILASQANGDYSIRESSRFSLRKNKPSDLAKKNGKNISDRANSSDICHFSAKIGKTGKKLVSH